MPQLYIFMVIAYCKNFAKTPNRQACFQGGMWKRKRKLEAEAVEAVIFLRKRKREKSTAST